MGNALRGSSNFGLNLSVTITGAGTASGSGTFNIIDVDGDQLAGTLIGQWSREGSSFISFRGAFTDVTFVDNGVMDGYFNGLLGDVPMPLSPADSPLSGGLIQLTFGAPSFFAASFSNRNTAVSSLGSNWTTAQPNQIATATAPRTDPGPGSTQIFTFQDFYIAPSVPFSLGPNETLNLNNGTGNLVITPGAIFSGNGLIFGNVINQGLIRIPPTRIGTINITRGGNIVVPVPPSFNAPVVLPSSTPLQTRQDTMLSFTGSGGGGWSGGGNGTSNGGSSGSFSSGGGRYVLNTPSVTVQGTTGWDGELEVTGFFEQTSTGFLRLFIAGPEQGETYSLLSVGETATIDGTIQVVLDPTLLGFTPSVGDSFDMIVADLGITTAPGLAVQTLITADGAAALGLALDPFDSPFAMDPDDLVLFPTNIFDVTLVNDGTTLRFTLNQPICSPQPIATTAPSCGRDTAEFTVPNAGSGPFTFQWQIEDAPNSDLWSNLEPGLYPDLGTVLTPTERTMSIRRPRFFASGTRIRCIIQNPCDTIITAPVELAVIDQTAEPCGGCPICEADFDDNGGVDGGDLASFFTAFEEGVLCADVDRNGGVDGGDLATFFTLFEAGGCE